MATRLAWLLNLDAERELRAPAAYRREAAMDARIAALRGRMTRLLDPEDGVIGLGPLPHAARPLAFCPTPTALRRIREAGLAPPPAPSLEVLRRVNGRAFCAALGQTLPGARYVHGMAELRDALRSPSPSAVWLLKRDYSFAGQERRRVFGSELDASTQGFAENSFARAEGLQLEPWVTRLADFAQHGYVLSSGRILVGSPCMQECSLSGCWERSLPLPTGVLERAEQGSLAQSVCEAGEALARAGYFGPFGVDAYRYQLPGRAAEFQPRSEINARFSMGYPRELLERALAEEG